MRTIKGDLLQMADNGDFDAIVHGCNCFNVMGGGIARQIKERYLQAFSADSRTKAGDRSKLGTFTTALAQAKDGKYFVIVNAYTQYDMAAPGEDVFEYDSFQKILDTLADTPMATGTIGFPMIGMGLAGGDSKRILTMIREFDKKIHRKGGSVTMVEFG